MGINLVWPGIEPVKNRTCLDLNLLRSAESQPYQHCFGQELYPTLAAKAAYLFYHLASGHVFSNGNKRTAAICLDTFLMANSRYLTLSNDEVHDLAQDVASAGERNDRFNDLLPRITVLIEGNMLPFSAFRLIDTKAYRQFLKTRKSIRESPFNREGWPMVQND